MIYIYSFLSPDIILETTNIIISLDIYNSNYNSSLCNLGTKVGKDTKVRYITKKMYF